MSRQIYVNTLAEKVQGQNTEQPIEQNILFFWFVETMKIFIAFTQYLGGLKINFSYLFRFFNITNCTVIINRKLSRYLFIHIHHVKIKVFFCC